MTKCFSMKFFLKIGFYYFVCMDILPVHVSMCHERAWCWRKPEEALDLGTKIIDLCELLCGCWD